jgi:hypothetical protein
MSEFKKYQHIEKEGPEVDGLLNGKVYVFPKIDGTNASIWFDGSRLCFGSRNRELDVENDNACFMDKHINDSRFIKFFSQYPHLRLFGEWLVPHTIKKYRDDSWHKFYVFDIQTQTGEYIQYEKYRTIMESYDINYIPAICTIDYPSMSKLKEIALKDCHYLMEDGCNGEGIVCKRYDFINQYGRTTWLKIVNNEFKDKHLSFKTKVVKEKTGREQKIIDEWLTDDIIDKVYANICNMKDGWTSKCIPRLLETVYYDLITECTYNIIKKLKNPVIDFKELKKLCDRRVKQHKKKLF